MKDFQELPNSWQLVPLKSVAQIIMGQSPPSSTYNEQGDGLPFFQGKSDFGYFYPTPRVWCTAPSRIAEPDDVLVSVRAPVGPVNLAKERCGIGRGLGIIRVHRSLIDPFYAFYYFRVIEPLLVQRSSGSTFAAINRSDIEYLSIPLPPLPEQRRIVAILRKADELRQLRQRANQRARDLLPALFYEMFLEKDRYSDWDKIHLGEITPFITRLWQ